MAGGTNRALLPEGLRDGLPPIAAHEAEAVNALMGCFASHGFERVEPPLIEFEDNLLAGAGKMMERQTFRLMDPLSQRMMGLRADMTPQMARIATTRFADAPRPLRLCYAGQVFRVKGTQLRPERQFRQVGVELIGTVAPERADAEVVRLAIEALSQIGITGLSVDLNLPTLAPTLCSEFGLDDEAREQVRGALLRKDSAAIAALGGAAAELFGALLEIAGPAESAFPALRRMNLPKRAADDICHLIEVGELIGAGQSNIEVIIDPLEARGFDYHVGVCFTLFARASRGELGSGGRYLAGDETGREPSTGFTLLMDAILPILPEGRGERRLFLPLGTPDAVGDELRKAGWATVAGLEDVADAKAEARRLGCAHTLLGGQAVTVLESTEEA
jgi:ATP phosphoribosyltransferase regulatory subunit